MAALPTTEIETALGAAVLPALADLRGFVDRRIAELSAELHASVQMADMTEEKLSRELAMVHERIASLVAMPTARTRSSGVELEAVVMATEAAANIIMEAAEAIQHWISSGARDPAAIDALAEKVNSIFEACSFQDVTGQRIRRAIQHLQQVETMLERIAPMPVAGHAVQVRTAAATVSAGAMTQVDMAQAEIDALLNG
jgi:chemotaxis protein CheZ